MRHKRTVSALLAALAVSGGSVIAAQTATAGATAHASKQAKVVEPQTTTPIKHVVVIFQENVSFDHYFGTYPSSANTDGQPFKASKSTPAVDGLLPATSPSIPAALQHSTNLLYSNPNSSQPQRLDSSATGLSGNAGGQLMCDQDHNYSDEQQSFDNGNMDRFVQSVGTASGNTPFGTPCNPSSVMDYYDGNAVTGLWNYAQHYAMSDNSFGTTFGPSAPGAVNLVAGDTGNVDMAHLANNPSISTSTSPDADLTANGLGGYSLTSDAQPYWDDCSTRDAVAMSGTNIGDELNGAGLSWGWFEGGLRPSTSYQEALTATGKSGQPTSTFTPDQFSTYFSNAANRPAHSSNQNLCSSVHPVGVALGGSGQWGYKDDYIPHHEPFQYYASTANPHHLAIPTNSSGQDTLAGLHEIGRDTQSYVTGTPQFNTPNHQYDTSDFNQLVEAINRREVSPSTLPAVSFLKAPGFQDGHAAYSEPADEQQFIATTVNELMRSPDWKNTVVMVNYDDSDGWYDHVYSGVTNPSLSPADNLTNTSLTVPTTGTSGQCGGTPQGTPETPTPLANEQGRCGFGPRLPMMVISPYAKKNSVDHNLSDQASMINFIEYNWGVPGIPGSADQVLASKDASEGVPFDLAGMFEFAGKKDGKLFLNPTTGQKQSQP
ncbi:MAG TPA: alkaline phosphatase family protein [Solirubrobacteraceae bacterium]|nr:alkaline phosphatase family protein [Solirubrobacteraceae bacterium]